MLIDNAAYSNFKINNNTTDIEAEFKKALKIRKENNIYNAISLSHLHLSEYYSNLGKTSEELKHLREGYKTSKLYNTIDDRFKILKKLAIVDSSHAADYLNEYIDLREELILSDRKTREKFTKIRFQTDDYKNKNKKTDQKV
ncbi:hypothetical protein [Aquimarina agarivorans]|uniref:hypothetical protein n=1 Tax=Aquimarina agarivorans TaxID=980584 RepID=UPI0002DD88E1|nr:hypothetical protein [Aquimarina agarivorans]